MKHKCTEACSKCVCLGKVTRFLDNHLSSNKLISSFCQLSSLPSRKLCQTGSSLILRGPQRSFGLRSRRLLLREQACHLLLQESDALCSRIRTGLHLACGTR